MMENQQQPSIKSQRLTDEKKSAVSLNKLPNWILGKIFRKLPVVERLRRERVNRRWRATMWEFGWTGQKELDYYTVFYDAEGVNPEEFTNESLVALFKRLGKTVIKLDLLSFFSYGLPTTPYICGSLSLLPNLVKIDISGINLSEAVPFLSDSLRGIRTDGPFTEGVLSALAKKCPDLEAINFFYTGGYTDGKITASSVNAFLSKYPNLKKLHLDLAYVDDAYVDDDDYETLTSIAELKKLEEFQIKKSEIEENFSIDVATFVAIIEGCQSLRRFEIFGGLLLSEGAFCELTKLPNLVELKLPPQHFGVTADVVKELSECQNLKKLNVTMSPKITEDSVVYLVERSKSLVALDVQGCPRITERSLEAVVAEVNKRHGGNPPKTLPKGPADPGIFYFPCEGTDIDMEKALALTANNPWIEVETTDELEWRSFL